MYGPKPAKEIYAAARHSGLVKRTVDRAKAKLGIAAHKHGMSGGWVWSLAEGCQQASKVAKVANNSRQENLATFGGFGNLRGSSSGIGDKRGTQFPSGDCAIDDGWEGEI
jgi:hypothetical protein